MGYDTKCYDLAEAFLSDHPTITTPQRVNLLAQMIQNTLEGQIELWIEEATAPRSHRGVDALLDPRD